MTARRKSLLYLEKIRLLHAVITATLAIAVLAWAIVLWQRGQASGGDVVLVCTLGFTILHATRDLAVALVDVTQHMARLAEAIATLLQPHVLRDPVGAAPLESRHHDVVFERVSFAYPAGRPVLEDLSLRFEAGQRTGLVGPSGSGKSTILKLLQRLADVDAGRIRIDGQDIARITQESVQRAISYVPQDISLLHRPVLDNIRYGKPEACDAEVKRVAEMACCRDFIEALPEGFATVVGERGARLSGGQRQRIAIARALLKDSPILLLDEATSSLDAESETLVQAALERLMAERTTLVIAHRLATVLSCDRILVMDQGRIVEEGTHERLAAAGGLYARLAKLQFRTG
jgi:ATP-binding cassette subfamily B protein